MGIAPCRLLIDTDPGIDDALALLLALASPEARIEAITVVAGNVGLEATLANALRIVEAAGVGEIAIRPQGLPSFLIFCSEK